MSLYDDLLPADEIKSDKESKTKPWSNSSLNLLQHHLQNRKQQPKPNHFKPRQTIFKSSKPPPPIITSQQTFTPSKYTGSLLGGDWNVSLEYDPFWPNDYEKIVKERKVTTQVTSQPNKATTFVPLSTTPVLTLGSRPLVDAYSDDDDEEDDSKVSKGVSIAPPPSLMAESSTVTTTPSTFNSVPPPSSQTPDINALNMNVSGVAAKIMARMGYKEGKGLGKNQQGISTALQVEKTSKNSGVIISNSNIVTNMNKEEFTMPNPPSLTNPTSITQQQPDSPQQSITEMMKNPTKVIMLRNMVGQGEVDPDLDPEVREECSKFGEVNNCVIYEVNEGLVNGKRYPSLKLQDVSDDNGVRIFVEFSKVESAIKALIDLNGRYFGGRVVRGQFYDFSRFKNMDLYG